MMVPAFVTATLTFDTASDELTKGESAIVFEVLEVEANWWRWTMLSIDRPRVIVKYFQSPPARVFKSWLRPDA